MSSASRRAALHQRGVRLEGFTVGWNVLEALVAVTAGVVSGSAALLAFGFDSVIESLSGGAVLWRLHHAGPRASTERSGTAERRALRLVAVTFGLLAGYIVYESGATLIQRTPPESSTIGLVLAGLSLLIMPALAYLKGRTGRELGSESLQADAIETWVCAWLSLALLAGVGLNALYGWWWADPVAALAMLPVVAWQAWRTWREAGA